MGTHRIPQRYSSYAVGVGVILLFACDGDGSVHDHDDFREDVVMCEDAVAYLTSCCPSFDPHVLACNYSYDYTPGSCNSGATTESVSPALSVAESGCILSRSCNTIRASGVCDRAQIASPYQRSTSSSASHAAVCP